jgi:hypothetical protein
MGTKQAGVGMGGYLIVTAGRWRLEVQRATLREDLPITTRQYAVRN